MKKVYAIIGQKRSGKDTTADYICSKLNCNKYPLAQSLKELVCNIFNISMEKLDEYKNEKWDLFAMDWELQKRLNISFRSILQKTGDSMKDFFGIDCFMKKFYQKLLNDNRDYAVIPDVRLKEEQDWLIIHSSPIFIKIIRDITQDTDSTHRSETETNKLGYDILIENNGTIDDLYKKIDEQIFKQKN